MMYCEARTSTGLGCDSLGIEQCLGCFTEQCNQSYRAAYTLGIFKPNYPVPATSTYAEFINWHSWNKWKVWAEISTNNAWND
jgi:hypothetical protein